jgi:flavodoxin
VADIIRQAIGCDVYRITAADPCSDSYDATVARNVREQDGDARPAIAGPPASLDGYDTVLLGSPVWNVRPPMILSTFTEAHDFTGKTVLPLVTYAVSGLGRTAEVYTASCRGATLGEGLAVRGEQASGSRAAVDSWLRRPGRAARLTAGGVWQYLEEPSLPAAAASRLPGEVTGETPTGKGHPECLRHATPG